MPDEPVDATTSPAEAAEDKETPDVEPASPVAPNAPEKKWTDGDVDRIVRERLDRDRRSRTRKAKKPSAPNPKQPDDGDDLEARLRAEFEATRRFDRLALRHGLTEGQAERMFSRFQADAPDDPDAWLTRELEVWGVTPTTDKQPDRPEETEAKTLPEPRVQVPTGAPAKVNRLEADGLIDIFALTQEERAQLGPDGIRREFEKILADHQRRSGAPPVPHHPRLKR